MSDAGQIILHIGLHKTATGTLQRQFFPACSDLHLLTTRVAEMRAFVAYVTRTDPLYFDAMHARGLVESVLDPVRSNMLSNESLSGPPYAGVIEGGLDHRLPILQNLHAAFPDAKVILVLRRQDAFAKSLYRQYLKSGGTRSIRRFYGIGETVKPPLVSLNRFLFSRYVNAVRSTFPRGVLVLVFEDFVQNQLAWLQKLQDFAGISLPDIELKKENATSMGAGGMEFTRVLNYFFRSLLNPAGIIPGFRTNRGGQSRRVAPIQYLHDHWPGGKGSGNSKIEQAAQEILDLSREDNRRLDIDLNLGLQRFDYY